MVSREIMKDSLPYGMWTFSNGTVEIFNRKYETIVRKGAECSERPTKQTFFYSDKNSPWNDVDVRIKCETILRIWLRR